jgi:hypothetical protein
MATTHTRSWTHDDRIFALIRTGASLTLTVDDAPVLVATKEAVELLGRHIAAVCAGRPLNAGRRWTDAEDARLEAAWAEHPDVKALAAVFERSRSAIEGRLVHLGLREDDGRWRAFQSRA